MLDWVAVANKVEQLSEQPYLIEGGGASKLRHSLTRDLGNEQIELDLLLIFMPPNGGLRGCLLPSAKDVVLGLPLILWILALFTYTPGSGCQKLWLLQSNFCPQSHGSFAPNVTYTTSQRRRRRVHV